MYSVYVVDDDPVILDEIVTSVPWMDNGFTVIGFSSSPQTALAEMMRLKPQVVCSDLKMPELDGIELMQQLAQHGIACECIMLSAFDSFEDTRRFFRSRGFDYLLKPIQQQEVQIVLERLSKRLAETYPEEPVNITPAFQDLTLYLNANYAHRHTLESLSKRFGLSPNYICNLFAKHYGSTLTRYITVLRMEAAVRMMREQRKAFKEIAIDCGYPDYFYFCKVFKEFYGLSPTAYLRKWVAQQGQGGQSGSKEGAQ